MHEELVLARLYVNMSLGRRNGGSDNHRGNGRKYSQAARRIKAEPESVWFQKKARVIRAMVRQDTSSSG